MKRVRKKDTAPELLVRRALHAVGLRYRLHDKTLPGSPDLVLPLRRSVVFVHGCFWHRHSCPRGSIRPKRNTKFWEEKLLRNVARDMAKQDELISLGWRVEIVWECGCSPDALSRLARELLAR